MRLLSCVPLLALLWGCVAGSSLHGVPLPPDAKKGRRYYVEHQPNDGRNLDKGIALALRRRGLNASTEKLPEFDYLVTYVDRWHWSMRTFLIDLRIEVRDAHTNLLVATARSYQNSNHATGQTHQSIIDRLVQLLASWGY